MSIEKTVVIDKIEIVNNDCVQVRKATLITENGNVIAKEFHRHVIAPGNDYSGEDARVRAICSAMHTPEVVAAYRAAIERQ